MNIVWHSNYFKWQCIGKLSKAKEHLNTFAFLAINKNFSGVNKIYSAYHIKMSAN